MDQRQTGKKKGAGCAIFVVLGIALLVVGLVAVGVMSLFWASKAAVDSHELARTEVALMETEAAVWSGDQEEEGTVVISQHSLTGLADADFGEELSREHFVAVMVDDRATDLMRQRFNEKASGRQVTWRIKVGDVDAPAPNGTIGASCSLPYAIHRPHERMRSGISIRVEFPPEATGELTRVRRGQWLTVTGKLELEDQRKRARIKEARVVKEAVER